MRMRRRGRGLIGAAATTAVVVGTAGAVKGHQQQKAMAQQQQAAAQQQQAAAQQAAAAAPAPAAEPDYMVELDKLAQLKNQGVITEEEFQAKKKQILGI